MTLVVLPVTLPSALVGQQNGRLDPSLLVDVVDPSGGSTVRLLKVAARSQAALVAAARAAGFVLKATGRFDGYRPYEVQQAVFQARYSTEPQTTGLVFSRVWNGVRYWLIPGNAPSAVPGTSNHGWGLAEDFGEERDADPAAESISDAAVTWLNANAPRFGWSAELQVEPWHWRHTTGDVLTPAVLAYEQNINRTSEETPMRYRMTSLPNTPAGADGRVHYTDGMRYRLQPLAAELDKLASAAGAGPVITVRPVDVPDGWDYPRVVAALCGTLDPGEQAGGVADHRHAVADTGPAVPLTGA